MKTNTEIVRAIYEALARGDVPAVLASFAPDLSWTEAEGFPYGGTYQGPDAVVENVLAPLGSEWAPFTVTPEEFIAEGDQVVSLGLYAGTWKATGKSFSAPYAHVWRLRDGKVVRFRQFTDTAVVQTALE